MYLDDKVWRYNENKILERGFPQRVSSLDLPENPDAAIQLRKDGKVYVFKGNFLPFIKFSLPSAHIMKQCLTHCC